MSLMPEYTLLAERITVYASITGRRFDSQEEAQRESRIYMILEVMASTEEEALNRKTMTMSRDMAKRLLDSGIVDEFTLEKKYREEMDRRQEEECEDVPIEDDSNVNNKKESEGEGSGAATGGSPSDEGTDV